MIGLRLRSTPLVRTAVEADVEVVAVVVEVVVAAVVAEVEHPAVHQQVHPQHLQHLQHPQRPKPHPQQQILRPPVVRRPLETPLTSALRTSESGSW
jgi:hypothetical protein